MGFNSAFEGLIV